MLQFLRISYEPLIATGELHLITKSSLNQLIAQVQNANNTYTNLVSSRDQGSFQNFAITLDGFVQHTRMYGVPYLASGGAQLELQRQAISMEVSTLTRNNAEVEALKSDVRTLITPAIAGSLSEAFRQRRDSLYRGRMTWLLACLVLGGFAAFSTFDFVHTVSSAIVSSKGSQQQDQGVSLWAIVAIRTVALLPLFAAFGFSFAQYKKERDFEEEYAHKAAVANSLPNYGDLAREPGVRDRIVTAATSVIFISPSEQARKAETSDALAGGMREVVEAMGKALGKK